jgi:cell wall-associated NlpC family hydrolase
MSLAELRDSLALWRRRHTWRQRRLDYAHLRNDAAGIARWQELLEQAGRMIRQREHQIAALTTGPRDKIVAVAQQAKANYDRNPGAYHYLAGGVPNTTILAPTPRNYRSDCSQFAVNVYRLAGVPCPGSGTYLYSNTISIEQGGRIVARPQPGDLGMYGARGRTHHVEVYIGGGKFIGHGTARIDSLTPGQPSFYLSFLP